MAQIGETELDVRALWRALRRRAWPLVLLAVAVGIVTYVGLSFVDPLYTADTSILIEQRESPLTRPREDAGAPPSDFDTSAIQSQVEVVKSREIAERVIDKLDLTHRPEFDPARRPSAARSLLVLLGLGENPADSTIRQRVMDSYFSRLSVYPLLQSRVIGIEFSAPDPNLAAQVANAVASAFVQLQQDAKRDSAVAATEWLQQEIERLRGRVAGAEQAVADYRQKHGLFTIDQNGAAAGNLSTQQLGDINAELARARAARAEAEARAQLVGTLLEEGGAPDASEEVLNSQLIQRLRERQGALKAQIADLSTALLPTHPRIRALQQQVGTLEKQIHEETAKVLESLKTAARVAAAREASLEKSLSDAKAAVSTSNDQDIELHALEREASAQRDLLESFLARYREAAARTDANYLPADARIISQAVAPSKPSFPKKTMMAIAATVATLLLASAIVLLSEFMSGSAFRLIGFDAAGGASESVWPAASVEPVSSEPIPVEADDLSAVAAEAVAETAMPPEPDEEAPSASDVAESDQDAAGASDMALTAELLDQTPVPGTVEGAEEVAAEELAGEESAAGEAVVEQRADVRREALLAASPIPQPEERAVPPPSTTPETANSGSEGLGEIIANTSVRVALFAGAEGGEGTGAIAFSAARQAAKQKLRCIVIDVGRTVSQVLGNERPGLGDLLTGAASFGEVIQRDDTARVHVIPLGGLDRDTPMQRMRLVIGALTHTYDKVIVVADKVDDWPDEYLTPDIAAIVCGADTTEALRTELYDFVLARGAHSAVIVRYSDFDLGDQKESAAA